MEEFEWTVVNEGHLLDAMVGHKPVGKLKIPYPVLIFIQVFWMFLEFLGVNKYFQMAFICDKFTDNLHKDIDPEKIWAHLETMYNLEVLDESESIPFPNGEKEFILPESEFGSLINKKEEEKSKLQTGKGGRETPKLLKEIKKEEKTQVKTLKEHRDSKEGKDNNKTQMLALKKEIKKEMDIIKKTPGKGRIVNSFPKEEKIIKIKSDETPKTSKRPTRGSLKPNDDSGSSGKSSPITVTATPKRRRI